MLEVPEAGVLNREGIAVTTNTELKRSEWERRFAATFMNKGGWNERCAILEAGLAALEREEAGLPWTDSEQAAAERLKCWVDSVPR